MRFKTTLIAAVLAALLMTSPALAQKAGQPVPLNQIPAAITTAIEKAYPKSTIVSAAKMGRGGQERYQISLKTTADATAITILAAADGSIRANRNAPAQRPGTQRKAADKRPEQQQDLTIEIKDLPKAVTKAIKEAYPKDEILAAQKVLGVADLFVVSLNDVSSMSPLRVFVTADGKIQKR